MHCHRRASEELEPFLSVQNAASPSSRVMRLSGVLRISLGENLFAVGLLGR